MTVAMQHPRHRLCRQESGWGCAAKAQPMLHSAVMPAAERPTDLYLIHNPALPLCFPILLPTSLLFSHAYRAFSDATHLDATATPLLGMGVGQQLHGYCTSAV